MPIYEYECSRCKRRMDERRGVTWRDMDVYCTECPAGTMKRVFTPTATVLVPEHFRHDQSQFQPMAWDTAAWEARSKGHQSHAPQKPGEDFQEHLERDLRGSR